MSSHITCDVCLSVVNCINDYQYKCDKCESKFVKCVKCSDVIRLNGINRVATCNECFKPLCLPCMNDVISPEYDKMNLPDNICRSCLQ